MTVERLFEIEAITDCFKAKVHVVCTSETKILL